MHRDVDRTTDAQGLRFFGTVVAAQCHEVINVLNILNEVAGLIEDLAGASVLDAGRVQALAQKIQAQIQRGQGLVRGISRFAHSTDRSSALVDVSELVRGALELLERPVRLAGSTLQPELPTTPVVVEADPFALLRAVFSAVEVWLTAAPAAVALRLRAEDSGVRFEVERTPALEALDAEQQRGLFQLTEQLGVLGGVLREAPPSSATRITFDLPARAPHGARAPGTR